MSDWTSTQAPRIWRCSNTNYYGDEAMESGAAYTDDELAGIADDGFNGVWVRGKLQGLQQSRVLPDLDDPDASKRIDALRSVIERGKRHGIDLYLYFNEPLALEADHPFWDSHGDLKGSSFEIPGHHPLRFSLCTSTPAVRNYMAEITGSLFESLPGLGGVILITASEFLTHCWSHHARYSLHDGIHEPTEEPLECPRCRDREPADVVVELLELWARSARAVSPSPRVLAWNWSWSLWYPDPQAEIIERFPEGVELVADWERGSSRQQAGKQILIDEYSFSYLGPGERFVLSARSAAKRKTPVHSKMQLGTTHELATVPNLPLMNALYRKFRALQENDVQGIVGCWNFGSTPTLNRYAVGFFCREGSAGDDEDGFLRRLCAAYFGDVDEESVREGWRSFTESFESYPFSTAMVYWGPINYAPAYPLSPAYHDKPMGGSWRQHFAWGDRLEDCLGPFTLDESISLFQTMAERWTEGLAAYRKGLSTAGAGSEEQIAHRAAELRCAEMTGCHLESTLAVFRFHHWRKRAMEREGLVPPCEVRMDDEARPLLVAELANVERALGLVTVDGRLGYHEEDHSHMVDADGLRKKSQALKDLLASA